MRRLAAELGAGTMSLYRHVSGRDDVVELIVDAAYGDEPPPVPTGDWRADLRALAGRTRRIMLAHPWLAFEASKLSARERLRAAALASALATWLNDESFAQQGHPR
jgi:AcrR family transcriptional regulator